MEVKTADVVIIGAGIAGLVTALQLANDKKVIVIAKGELNECNSSLAQGGIAAVTTKEDNVTSHFIDTITAGDFHNEEELTKKLVALGKDAIQSLQKLGVSFDVTETGELSLCKEGAHSHPRILHAGGDATGREIMTKLRQEVKANITVIEHEMAMDLIISQDQCIGVWTKDKQENKKCYYAAVTVLASGGIGQLYEVTSNANGATGDGIAMAYRAGAQLADMEFVQFHPTMLIKDGKGKGLVSEAVRGEGATLVNQQHKEIMKDIHPLKDLAPRDVVAREIFFSKQRGDSVYLKINEVANFKARFPTITALCEDSKIDLSSGVLPVVPGAHFMMGGIKATEKGTTSIPRLYAVGEVACTGVHGANRLASNSLLEAVVFAKLASTAIRKEEPLNIKKRDSSSIVLTNFPLPNEQELREVMTNDVGIVRNEGSLLKAIRWFESYVKPNHFSCVLDLPIEKMTILNMLTVGWLITTSALQREESRGAHYRSDFKEKDNINWFKRQIVRSRGRNVGHFLCQGKTENIFS
jgi:L-aspartate oxidase